MFHDDHNIDNGLQLNGSQYEVVLSRLGVLNKALLCLSLGCIIVFAFFRRKLIPRFLFCWILGGIAINTLFYSLFSSPDNIRYLTRLSWLVVFFASVLVILYFERVEVDENEHE